MSKRESISRYNLIIKKLRKKPATFGEISQFLANESELQAYNFNISKRTFKRDIEDIASLYNIEIKYDFSRKSYFIAFEQEHDAAERILEAFDTFNALSVTDRLSDYIHFEKRRSKGTENLFGLIHAIKNRFVISFTYHKYWEDDVSKRFVQPFALHEFKNRWYVLGKDLKDDKVKTFALDRLSELVITKNKFQDPSGFNAGEYFKSCFGVIKPDGINPEEVILSFDPFQGKYIKSMPMHESQEIVADNEDELIIKLKVFITTDLIMELLSYGDDLKILKPESLISGIKTVYKNALKLYDQ